MWLAINIRLWEWRESRSIASNEMYGIIENPAQPALRLMLNLDKIEQKDVHRHRGHAFGLIAFSPFIYLWPKKIWFIIDDISPSIFHYYTGSTGSRNGFHSRYLIYINTYAIQTRASRPLGWTF